jgi:hypothetical protein
VFLPGEIEMRQIFGLMVLIGIFCAIIGWGLNIGHIISEMPSTFAQATPFWVLRIVGVFVAPLGALLGWF